MIKTYKYSDKIQLSPHFNTSEFRCKCGGTHDTKIDTDLIEKLEKLYEKLGCSKIIITSGFRCKNHDINVGGNGYGRHVDGQAADILCYDKNGKIISSENVCCAAQDVNFGGIANINSEYIYTHVDVRSGAKWYGDETKGNNFSVPDFYTYFDIKKAIFSGIDVSEHQKNIDWKKAKNEIDFAILRAGYGKKISQIDKYFEENYLSCKANKIPVGAYWYSYATTVEDAKKEAEICIEILKNKQFEYPVFFDLEEKSALDTGKNNCSEMVKIFCDTLEKEGYFVGLYISRSHLQTHINDEIKSKYVLWIAEYDTEKLNYNGSVGIWQKSCKGCILGISGDVDIDICYENYPEIIKSAKLNGFSEIAKNSVDVTVNIGEKTYSGTLIEK